MNTQDQRTVQGAAAGKGMTVAELRNYVQRLAEAGCPDQAHPTVRVTITGRIHVLSTKFDVAPGHTRTVGQVSQGKSGQTGAFDDTMPEIPSQRYRVEDADDASDQDPL